MIIGNGLIANSLINIDSKDHLFFASGVSNSLETRISEFEREFNLLRDSIEKNPDCKLVYFSTLSVNDQSKQNSHYVLHKLELEEYIKSNTGSYLILRIGNIVGRGGNPNTLFNFLKNQILNNGKFTVHRKARRLLLDIDDIAAFLNTSGLHIQNETVNFAFPYYYNLKEIINTIQEKIRKQAEYQESDEGDFYQVEFTEMTSSFFKDISPEQYLKVLAEKYI